MRAALVREFGRPLTIEEVDVPGVPTGQVLVEVVACGVCQTDLPFVPGHEAVGHVAAVGASADGAVHPDRPARAHQ